MDAFWDAIFARGDHKENYRNAKGEWRAEAVITHQKFLDNLAKALASLMARSSKTPSK
ncbi:MAG: hypothetical protein LBQ23_01215 [Puniceicoccales bacterium]|nr:hypothetical protein [Puniceicoccales bacterium]